MNAADLPRRPSGREMHLALTEWLFTPDGLDGASDAAAWDELLTAYEEGGPHYRTGVNDALTAIAGRTLPEFIESRL